MEMIKCNVCGNPMPKLRLTKFGYKSCVDCSTVGAYQAVNTTQGTGDHTWNDIQIMTPEQKEIYNKDIKKKAKLDSFKSTDDYA
ncbi:MAG: hypothetical protein GY936_15730 [Ignavibacteriae bacterium]|nr:hypothetical protein [Ignavibacteriota bacterium]|tara:strand:- start:3261 stop:3512 length:252 start_codon:yes stop_codon:yes gene_type:complete